jgi:AAA ATPase domain
LQALAASGLTRFVGRQTELATLHEALEHTSTGQGQVMAVIAEPSIGKTVSSASLPAPIIATGG